jgi:hypothetical protein
MLSLINLLLGGALLVAGRKLFWLFVGAAGFITGIQLATRFWQVPDVLAIIVGVVMGVIFALLAVFLQSLAIGVAGFLSGGYVLTALAGLTQLNQGSFPWIIFIIGGIIGVMLVIFLFDWALITLSSLAGASLIVQSFAAQGGGGGLIFFLLFIAGVLMQGSILRRERAATASS